MNLLNTVKDIVKKSDKIPFIIAVEGIIGSGKSDVANKLKEHFGKGAIVLATDLFITVNRNEWKKRVREGNIVLRDWYDLEKIRETLEKIKRKERFIISGLYDLSNGQFTKKIDFDATKCNVLLLEGLFAFDEKLKGLVDFKLFLDIPETIAIKRAEERDKTVRNQTHEQWLLKKTIYHDNYLPYLEKEKKKRRRAIENNNY